MNDHWAINGLIYLGYLECSLGEIRFLIFWCRSPWFTVNLVSVNFILLVSIGARRFGVVRFDPSLNEDSYFGALVF